ncbi:MAG: 2-amino-4-hydroxy-6-hydroxymethyldihydropteridine diphosphokinase [Ignavibacteria bacterium]|nr:2-amino-4-hydroxy-6-hydroxymethyldihydropteridine diphosphokinase [Ignavibacteria bacterium]
MINNKKIAYLGLGSNIGERIVYIEKVISELENSGNISILKISGIYETEPWGNIRQDDYLNAVLKIVTELGPMELLVELKSLEKKIGRTGNRKWSEREIDIDILFYEDFIIKNENLNIPHSFIEERKFVLVPLAEIAPDFIHPVLKKSAAEMLSTSDDKLGVTLYGNVKTEVL